MRGSKLNESPNLLFIGVRVPPERQREQGYQLLPQIAKV